MKKAILVLLCLFVSYLPLYAETAHRAAAPGSEMKVFNPDISAIVDVHAVFSDDKSVEDKDKIKLEELELVLQSYVYPGVFGNIVIGVHEHDGNWEVEPEEAYLSFYELPLGLAADIGRKLIDFGKINPVHKHHWLFASYPLAYQNIFGDHNWHDDGVQLSVLIPNMWDKYIKLMAGFWSGETLEQHHSHDHDHHHHGEGFEFHGKIYTGRLSANLLSDDTKDVLAGFSLAKDVKGENSIYGFDFTYKYRWPSTQRKFRWQNEVFLTDTDHSSPVGFYSLAHLALNAYWDGGVRYDWTQLMEDDSEKEWGAACYLTYHFNEMMYLRPEYNYRRDHDGNSNNTFMLQFVWGFGPHAHRIED